MLALVPSKLHAATFTYDLVLTDASNPTYSGTGVVTITGPNALQTFTNYTTTSTDAVTGLSFVIDGDSFNMNDAGVNKGSIDVEFSSVEPDRRNLGHHIRRHHRYQPQPPDAGQQRRLHLFGYEATTARAVRQALSAQPRWPAQRLNPAASSCWALECSAALAHLPPHRNRGAHSPALPSNRGEAAQSRAAPLFCYRSVSCRTI